MKKSGKTKKVLRKISNKEPLNKQDEKVLKNLVSVLKKPLKGKSLSVKDRTLIKETIQKSKDGVLTLSDLYKVATSIFQFGDIIKDYT